MTDNISIDIYETQRGTCPYVKWESKLNKELRSYVRVRLNRIRLGNLGDTKAIRNGIHEIRLHRSPGYRIYFGKSGNQEVLLLCAGSKKSQTRDIEIAIKYWEDYKKTKEKEA